MKTFSQWLAEKRLDDLSYPGDCDARLLVRAASHHHLTTDEGGNHITVRDKDGHVVTQIPRSVKPNGTCRSIIKTINNTDDE